MGPWRGSSRASPSYQGYYRPRAPPRASGLSLGSRGQAVKGWDLGECLGLGPAVRQGLGRPASDLGEASRLASGNKKKFKTKTAEKIELKKIRDSIQETL
jgi:hypothetical protein